MKTTLLCIGLLTLLLVACDKEQAPETSAEAPKRPSLAERKEAKRRERPAHPPAEEPAGEALPAPVTPPPAAPPEARAPVAPAPAAEPPPATPALSAEEQEAKRAEVLAERIAQMTEQFNSRMAERDANGDGLITKDEMEGPMQNGFERMDSNGDGAIDATEREAIIKNMTDRMAQFNRGLERGTGGAGGRGQGESDPGGE